MSAVNAFPRIALLVRWLVLLMVGCLPLRARGDELTRQVQEELRKRNLYFGNVDGRATEQVAAALRRYQQRKGFTPTGETDETTLRSLALLPPAPRVASAATPSLDNEPRAAGIASIAVTSAPWPDVTVLRSDEARRNPAPPPESEMTDPPPTPTVAPPPASASVHLPSAEAVRGFLEGYLRAGQSNDTETQMPFYGEHVDYLDEGTVDHRFIHADIDGYDRRWPERHFTLLAPVTLAAAPDHDPDKIVVNFHYRFAVKRPHDAPEGEMANTYTLQRSGPDSLRIVAMKESRVRNRK